MNGNNFNFLFFYLLTLSLSTRREGTNCKVKIISVLSIIKIKKMGTTTKRFIVKESRRSHKKIEVDFLIDSGAVYSLVPAAMLKKIGIRAYKTMEFILADGTKIKRKVGDAYFEYNSEGGSASVIFGEKGDEPLLGATTLESLGLMLNPFKRELYPMRMLLM